MCRQSPEVMCCRRFLKGESKDFKHLSQVTDDFTARGAYVIESCKQPNLCWIWHAQAASAEAFFPPEFHDLVLETIGSQGLRLQGGD